MSKKVNPTIFRLGKTTNWKSQYFEKKNTEQSLYDFKNLEIQKLIFKFFKSNNIFIHSCKLKYLDSNSLHIFISYNSNFESTFIPIHNLTNNQNKIKLIYKKKSKKYFMYKNFYRKAKKHFFYQYSLNYNTILNNNCNEINYNGLKTLIKHKSSSPKKIRINHLQYYKSYKYLKNYEKMQKMLSNSFLEKLFESLHLFMNNKLNIFLTFHQLNKEIRYLTLKNKRSLKNIIANLENFKNIKFIKFKELINTLFISIIQPNSSKMLAYFIAEQLKKLKRHNFFLKATKKILTLINNSLFKLLRIKIQVKGRFNGAPRAKSKTIQIGAGIPLLTINKNIDYAEETSFAKDGTFGVKVWTCENYNLHRIFKKKCAPNNSMLQNPRKTKYKKTKKGRLSKFEFKSNKLNFGILGLKAAESGIISSKQLESARQAITRKIKKKGKIWIKIFTDIPITSKPIGIRMGKGKGSVSHWGARVRGGTVLFEVYCRNIKILLPALKTGGAKLPIKTKIFN